MLAYLWKRNRPDRVFYSRLIKRLEADLPASNLDFLSLSKTFPLLTQPHNRIHLQSFVTQRDQSKKVDCEYKMAGQNGYGASTRYTVTALNRWSVADKQQLPGKRYCYSMIGFLMLRSRREDQVLACL